MYVEDCCFVLMRKLVSYAIYWLQGTLKFLKNIFNICFSAYINMCVCTTCAAACRWRPEDSWWELVSSFSYVGPGNQTQACGKYPHPLSCYTSLDCKDLSKYFLE